MRVPILLISSALMFNSLHAAPLSAADREALLDSLDKLRDAAQGKVSSRVNTALAAFRNARGSDDAALELYLNCMERVNFDAKNKKAADFREWKRKEADKLAEPGMKTALRCQLAWLTLVLEALPDKADRVKLSDDGRQILDSIFSSWDKLEGQRDLLSQSVTGSVFARAYEVDRLKVANFPLAPLQLDQVYQQLILPPLQSPSHLKGLQAAWIRRIQQEGVLAEGAGHGNHPKVGSQTAGVSPESEKFITETQPKLQWEMELDLFRNGDESGASVRMLALLEKNISHPSAKAWSEQLQQLLKPATAAEDAPEVGQAQP